MDTSIYEQVMKINIYDTMYYLISCSNHWIAFVYYICLPVSLGVKPMMASTEIASVYELFYFVFLPTMLSPHKEAQSCKN